MSGFQNVHAIVPYKLLLIDALLHHCVISLHRYEERVSQKALIL